MSGALFKKVLTYHFLCWEFSVKVWDNGGGWFGQQTAWTLGGRVFLVVLSANRITIKLWLFIESYGAHTFFRIDYDLVMTWRVHVSFKSKSTPENTNCQMIRQISVHFESIKSWYKSTIRLNTSSQFILCALVMNTIHFLRKLSWMKAENFSDNRLYEWVRVGETMLSEKLIKRMLITSITPCCVCGDRSSGKHYGKLNFHCVQKPNDNRRDTVENLTSFAKIASSSFSLSSCSSAFKCAINRCDLLWWMLVLLQT